MSSGWRTRKQALMVGMIKSYLLARGTKTALFLLQPELSLRRAVHFHDCQWWDNFVDLWKCALWAEMRDQEMHDWLLQRRADFLACGLMHCLLELTCCQLLYQNATVHIKVKDGMVASQHKTILSQIEEFLLTDPADQPVIGHAILQNIFAVIAKTRNLLSASCYCKYRQTVKHVVLIDWSLILWILKTDRQSIDVGRYATLYMEFLHRIKRSYVRPSPVFPQKYKLLIIGTLRVDTHTHSNVV